MYIYIYIYIYIYKHKHKGFAEVVANPTVEFRLKPCAWEAVCENRRAILTLSFRPEVGRDFLCIPVNILFSPQKCQGVSFSPICQKSLLLQRPHYTRSALQHSRLFGPRPWKILATTYEKKVPEQPRPWRKSLLLQSPMEATHTSK